MIKPSGNDIIRQALEVLASRLNALGHRWTQPERDILTRAVAALGGQQRLRQVPVDE